MVQAARRFIENVVAKPGGSFGFAYLGFWLAQFIDRVFVPVAVFPLVKATVIEWHISPFWVSIETTDLIASGPLQSLVIALPILLEMVFLGLLCRWGLRVRSAVLRILLHYTGFWIVLLMTSEIGVLAYFGRGRLGRALTLLVSLPQISFATRAMLAILVFLFLAFAGAMCAGRLIGDLRKGWLPAQRHSWLAVVLFVVAVLVILAGSNAFVLRFFGLRAVLFLLIPAAFCVLVALSSLFRKPKLAPTVGFSASGALISLCVAAALYGALHEAPRGQTWLFERHLQSFSSAHHQVLYDPKFYSAAAVEALAAEVEASLSALAARVNAPAERVHLRLVLYPSIWSLRAATGSRNRYDVDGTTIRALVGTYVSRLDAAAESAALVGAVWGPPGSLRMRTWVARWLAREWRGAEVSRAAGEIESEIGHYSVAQLVDSSSDGWLSPLVREPLGAAWIGSIFDKGGLAAVRSVYAAKSSELNLRRLARVLGIEPTRLEGEWDAFTSRLASSLPADPPSYSPGDTGFFFRGISFSHEVGGRGRGGYGSPEAAIELGRIRALGANAIALVPYGFVRGTRDKAISYTQTGETDEDLIQALYVAHGLGLKVMLKPQLWLGYTRFSGAMGFEDHTVRHAWMGMYREFVLHYARLAELERFDLLCIGSELGGLTRYENEWRQLIADVRRVYHGPVTYAANWGDEFDSLSFWDALDYIGVNNYYPLLARDACEEEKKSAHRAGGCAPHVEDLLPGARGVVEKLGAASRRWGKAVLFTEVGFPSLRGAVNKPWTEELGREVDLEEQAMGYEAIFRVFSNEPWFRGMFWWKWPSNGRGGGPRDPSYTPLGKPAAAVLHDWFTRMASTAGARAKREP